MVQKVFIVDDDDAVRKALALLLDSVGLDVACFGNAKDFLDCCGKGLPEGGKCLISDVRMPGMSGLEMHEEMIRQKIDVPVIFLSGYGDVPMAVKAMRGGAVSFLEKPVNEQELIDCIHQALQRGSSNGGRTREKLLDEHRNQLTPRQLEVLDLILQGLQTKHIARQLGLSPRTVDVHRAKILERLHAHSSAELIRQFLSNSLDP